LFHRSAPPPFRNRLTTSSFGGSDTGELDVRNATANFLGLLFRFFFPFPVPL
jgi:hypothetical protein